MSGYRWLATFVFALVVVTGCTPSPSTPTIPSITQRSAQGTAPPALDPSSVPPAWLSTLQAKPTVTLTPAPTLGALSLTRMCTSPAAGLPPASTGSLVIDGGGITYLLRLSDQRRTPLIQAYLRSVDDLRHFTLTSPDFRYFAFVDALSGTLESAVLRVVDAAGTAITSPTWKPEWRDLAGWLNDHQVLLTVDAETHGTMAVFDPFTSDYRLLSEGFADIQWLPPTARWYYHREAAIYDPTLTRVAYVASADYQENYVLRSFPAGGLLWTSVPIVQGMVAPKWSPDGTLLAVAFEPAQRYPGPGQLALVDREGNELRTYDLLALGLGSSQPLTWARISWSPEGDRIAFWLDPVIGGTVKPSLAILNVQSGEITDFCVEGGYATPIWSPDGHYVAAYNYILDTIDAQLYSLPDLSMALGWLVQPSVSP